MPRNTFGLALAAARSPASSSDDYYMRVCVCLFVFVSLFIRHYILLFVARTTRIKARYVRHSKADTIFSFNSLRLSSFQFRRYWRSLCSKLFFFQYYENKSPTGCTRRIFCEFFFGRSTGENSICDIFTGRNLCGCLEIINKNAKSFARRTPGPTTETEFFYGNSLRSIVCLLRVWRCYPFRKVLCLPSQLYLRACAPANLLKCCLLPTCNRLSTLQFSCCCCSSILQEKIERRCLGEIKTKNVFLLYIFGSLLYIYNAPSNFGTQLLLFDGNHGGCFQCERYCCV